MVKFIGSFDRVDAMPAARVPEYAFVGRSNVGKSSLLNALVGQGIARTSKTPGRTQQINVFTWRDVNLIDLPGYGYAKTSKTNIAHWLNRLIKYLTTREQLERLFILVDSRHGLKDSDLDMMDFCDENAVQYTIVLTKIDKKRAESKKYIEQIKEEIARRGAAIGDVIETSAEKKTGIQELKNAIIK
ncbi:MAG: ribosome biogenesis GTP-binding protein YihA/YsxC [Alphaproteobacteria bacterium]|nr:ribosome biogenesis GTP-binding protein YihA/YsxC [Alphaproteobacteria bacterium]